MSGMLRVNYVFMNRYMITASIRADGSSRLERQMVLLPFRRFGLGFETRKLLEREQLSSTN